MHRRLAGLAFALALVLALAVRPQPAAAHQLCFPADKTPHCLNDPFSDYWETNGGLPVFGYPVTSAANEVNADTGQTYLTQWVERTRLEDHPENAGTPYRVLLGLLGKERLAQLGRDYAAEGREPGPKEGCLWFDQTGHNVCNIAGGLGFRQYWESHGLRIAGLSPFERSLQLFGLPLTAPKQETNANGDTVLTQWFERARFEWHPGNPDEYKVLLGLLGKEVRGSAPVPPPANVAVVSHSNYINESTGSLWIVGEVINNTSSNQRFVKIVASLYDAGNTLIGSDFTYADLDILKPGQRSPFAVLVIDPPSGLNRYTLQVESRTTTEKPVEGVVIVSSGDRLGDIEGWRYIFGEVRNDSGSGVRFVKIVATLYNAQGTVVQADFTYSDLDSLAAGQTSPFEMLVLDWNGATRYELQVQAMKQQ